MFRRALPILLSLVHCVRAINHTSDMIWGPSLAADWRGPPDELGCHYLLLRLRNQAKATWCWTHLGYLWQPTKMPQPSCPDEPRRHATDPAFGHKIFWIDRLHLC